MSDALIAAFSAFAGALLTTIVSLIKQRDDSASNLSDMSLEFAAAVREYSNELENKVKELQALVDTLEKKIESMDKIIRAQTIEIAKLKEKS